MPLFNRLLCTVDHEPEGFHPDGTSAFAVNLNIETVVDTPSERSDEATASAVRETVFAFLEAVKTVRFHVYVGTMTGGALTHLGPLDGPLTAGDGGEGRHIREIPDTSDALTAWLKRRAKGRSDFWAITDPTTTSGVVEIEGDQLAATHLLRSAQAWDAPVAHRFGLTHLAQVPTALFQASEPPVDVAHLLLPWFSGPWFSGDAPPDTLDAVPVASFPGSFDIVFQPGGAFGAQALVCRSQALRLDETEHLGGALTADGYLTVDDSADRVRRLLVWFGDKTPGLLSPYTALAGVDTARSADGSPLSNLFAVDWKKADDGKPRLVAPEAAWLATTGLAGLLDPLILGLCRPASDVIDKNGRRSASEGHVLSRFVSAISSRVQTLVRPLDPVVADGLSPAVILSALRKDRAGMSLFNPQNRKDFVQALRTIYAMPVSQPDKAADAGAPVETVLLNVLLSVYETENPIEWLPVHEEDVRRIAGTRTQNDEPTGLCMTVSEALRPFQQALADEKGAETAIRRYLGMLFGNDAALLGKALLAAYQQTVPAPVSEAVSQSVKDAVSAGWAAFNIDLDSDFNGAQALRQSASADFVASWLKSLNETSKGTTAERLVDAFGKASFFRRRLLAPKTPGAGEETGCFDDILSCLPRIEPFGRLADGTEDRTVLKHYIDARDAAALHALEAISADRARFVPDAVPQPLSIALSADYSGHGFDDFAADFNGIGVLIRRMDGGAPRWSHANLADLTYTRTAASVAGSDPDADCAKVLHPAMPVASDGHAPLFQLYEGMPFATRSPETAAFTQPQNDEPFYRHDIADFTKDPADFAKVPSLAYGRRFESLAFVTTNAGTLPMRLRQADRPWIPQASPLVEEAERSPKIIAQTCCQRRTAIGAVSLCETDHRRRSSTVVKRLGVIPPGIKPLAHDYPRLGMVATTTVSGFVDLFRAPDGAGQLRLEPKALALKLTLSALRWHGDGYQLSVKLLTDPKAAVDTADASTCAQVTFELPPAPLGDMDLTLDVALQPTEEPDTFTWLLAGQLGDGVPLTPTEPRVATANPDDAFWLRLELTPAKTASSSVMFSLADPKTGESGDRGDRPLALLAPPPAVGSTDKPVWNSVISSSFSGLIVAPRVGYPDFERWFATDSRRSDPMSPLSRLLQALAIADALRDQSVEIKEALARLPDPAVSKLRVELCVTDHLAPSVPYDDVVVSLDVEAQFEALLKGMKEGATPSQETVSRLFADIEKLFSFDLMAQAIGSDRVSLATTDGKKLTAYLPPGVVAEIRVQPCVKPSHFESKNGHPPMFYKRMLELAQRRAEGNLCVFAGAAIQVETLYDVFGEEATGDVWSALTKARVACRPIPHARSYDLVSIAPPAEEGHRLWRAIGEIDVVTQRWRDTGRPIYTMLSPKAKGSSAAVDIQADAAVEAFEKEIFFEREPFDAETVTKPLDPMPATTWLQQIIWDAPSATYLRHRFFLRSRYAGALLLSGGKTMQTWPKSSVLWNMHVAMLADYRRLTLTRPQVRALVPLTEVPGADGKGSKTPPISVFLQERPYAHGGLADRIAAELKTGFGYAFDDHELLGIADSRKEIGPDPRLRYTALPKDMASALALAVEGPVGLTFDDPANPAAALPNSLQILTPVSTTETDLPPLEEHFAGISLRRYIDPAWIVDDASTHAEQAGFDPNRCWWIAYTAPGFQQLDEGKDGHPVLWIDAQPIVSFKAMEASGGDRFSVTVPSVLLDPKGSRTLTEFVELAVFVRQRVKEVSILHQALAPGRFSSAVFVRLRGQGSCTEAGRTDRPVMLCSFEWSAAPSIGPTTPLLRAPAAQSISRCIASTPTPIAWVRTGRDFNRIAVHPHDARHPDLAGQMIDMAEIVAVATPADAPQWLSFRKRLDKAEPLWLAGTTLQTPYPLHVHRHLAVIGTHLSRDIGRSAEIFSGAFCLFGPRLDLPKATAAFERGRIVEFETPAAILCASQLSPAIPATYKSAYFDLTSRADDSSLLQLHIRFVGTQSHLQKLSDLKLELSSPSDPTVASDDPTRVPLTLPLLSGPLKPGIFPVGARVTHQPGGNGKGRHSIFQSRCGDGFFRRRVRPDDKVGRDVPQRRRGRVHLKIIMPSDNPEVWADVSLLTGNREQGLFDFDWIFSNAAHQAHDIATKPEALSRMHEAQARIIAVSPPFDIVGPSTP